MIDNFLIHNPIAKQIVEALDVLAMSHCFAKTHRPEEQKKIADARATLDALRGEYPTTYAMTMRRLGRIVVRKSTAS